MSPTARGNARTLSAARRRMQILHAAMGIGSKRGLASMTMDEVAQAAKLSKGLPFYYFGSKQKLHLAMIDLFSEGISGRVASIQQSDTDPQDMLRAVCWEFVSALTVRCTHPRILIEFWSMALRDREIAGKLGSIRERMIEWIAQTLEHASVRSKEPGAAAQALYAALVGIASQWVLSKKAFDPQSVLAATLDGFLSPALQTGGRGT